MFAAGRLRQRITLQRLTIEKDTRGQDVQTWATIATPWAQVQMLSGDEAVAAMQVNPEAKWQVNMRWRPDISTKDRILYDDGCEVHTLSIVSIVDRHQRHEELELTCAKVQT